MKTLYIEGLANYDGPEPWKALQTGMERNERVLR